MPPKAKGSKKKGGYQKPERIEKGYIVNDVYKKPWCLGKPIGQGGFGLIYIASQGKNELEKSEDEAAYVIKIEPKENGPLFCEIHFYTNCSKKDELNKFVKEKNLIHLAMPRYISSGTCIYKDKDFRFLVMDRYETDLQRILEKQNNRLTSEIGILCIMRQILYALEYIHQRGYAHADIKGANLMLKSDNQAYLVDFGLAYRFKRDNIHQKYDAKPDRRHNGTIEYTSRDAHDGAQTSRRSDLEILGYCIIHWTCGILPWIGLIKNPVQVQLSKKENMADINVFLKSTLQEAGGISGTFIKFMKYFLTEVNNLEFNSEPQYQTIQNKISDTLSTLGHTKSNVDNFYIFNSNSLKKTKIQEAGETYSNINDISNGKKFGTIQKSDFKIENAFYHDSDDIIREKKPIAKQSTVLPEIFDETEEISLKTKAKSPIVKINSRIKKASNFIQSPQASSSPSSPVRETPKRKAKIITQPQISNSSQRLTAERAKRKHSYNESLDSEEGIVENVQNKKENMTPKVRLNNLNDLISKEDLNLNRITNKPVYIKKKKQKESRTIHTQTENSFLLNIRNKVQF